MALSRTKKTISILIATFVALLVSLVFCCSGLVRGLSLEDHEDVDQAIDEADDQTGQPEVSNTLGRLDAPADRGR